MKTNRQNRRQQYINSLEHDREFFTAEIKSGKTTYWHHGECHHISMARHELKFIEQELKQIEESKQYKPWKESVD